MRQTGRVTVKINGDVLASGEDGATIRFGGPNRSNNGMTDQGEYFSKEMLEPSEVQATLIHVLETDVDAIRSFRDGVLTFETDTGQVWSISGAEYKEGGELSSGELSVTFAGPPAQRVS